jgi:monoamine oxidase
MRVCVIGAGLAGLVAARSLAERGIEPVVLEARRRVGGRVYSQQLANDAVAERGAEFAEQGHHTVARVAGWLGLGLVPVGVRSGEREPRGMAGATAAGVRAEVARLQRLLARGGGIDLAGRSAAEILAPLGMDPGALQAIESRLQVSWGRPVRELDASVLEHVGVTFSPAESLRVAGGNQRIALRLAERLGPLLWLDAAALAVEWSTGGVRVQATGGWVDADACVVAVPARVLDRIRFRPALPDWKVAAHGRVVYGHGATLVVPLEREVAPSAVLSVPERFWAWTAKSTDGKAQRVVSAFAGSRAALEGLGVRDGPDRWVERLRALRPELAVEAGEVVMATWSEDPWSLGAYSTRGLGWDPKDADLLARPVGRLHFAGEHTAGRWSGSMEGALRSGLRAADDILSWSAGELAAQEGC